TLVYNDNRYVVERASLVFANPYRMEPVLDLVARTEVAEYDVTLSLFGPLDRLAASFSSDPPLPDLEVLSLLVSGSPTRLSSGFPELGGGDASTSAAEGLLFGQAASLISERVGALFGFDAFRIEPLSTSGGQVSSARVTVGKRFSSRLYVTYSYDPSTTGEQRIQAEYQLGEGWLVRLTQEEEAYTVDFLRERRF
ncbi:MAG: translocation/assembly module TamB domain-containing protein, partial [Thermoanaerobaculia bacterium]|nr:translocation/assembly module TamB domain-containing protein [Thermoanaerobaculia bacterium]